MGCGTCGQNRRGIEVKAPSVQPPKVARKDFSRPRPLVIEKPKVPIVRHTKKNCPLCRSNLRSVSRRSNGVQKEIVECVNPKCSYTRKA